MTTPAYRSITAPQTRFVNDGVAIDPDGYTWRRDLAGRWCTTLTTTQVLALPPGAILTDLSGNRWQWDGEVLNLLRWDGCHDTLSPVQARALRWTMFEFPLPPEVNARIGTLPDEDQPGEADDEDDEDDGDDGARDQRLHQEVELD